MLSTGGMNDYAREHAGRGGTAIMATEIGMLHPLRKAAPDVEFIAANERRVLRLHEDDHAPEAARRAEEHASTRCKVPEDIAERARIPIERMVAIS